MQRFKVSVRVKPPLNTGTSSIGISPSFQECWVKPSESGTSSNTVLKQANNTYVFDNVMPPNATQSDVFKDCMPTIENFMSGYNSCILAYGQTGSGKTHTTLGTSSDPGIIPSICDYVLNHKADTDQLKLSCVEIYKENVMCMISGNKVDRISTGGNIVPISTSDEACATINKCIKQRKVSKNAINEKSSRSHCVICLYLEGDNSSYQTKFYLVDLAGSESVKQTSDNNTSSIGGVRRDATVTETININKSLLTLNRIIRGLACGNSTQLPYRDSKLTMILRDAISMESSIFMIATVHSNSKFASDSVNTLKYASTAKKIKLKPKHIPSTSIMDEGRAEAITAQMEHTLNNKLLEFNNKLVMKDRELAEKDALLDEQDKTMEELKTRLKDVDSKLEESNIVNESNKEHVTTLLSEKERSNALMVNMDHIMSRIDKLDNEQTKTKNEAALLQNTLDIEERAKAAMDAVALATAKMEEMVASTKTILPQTSGWAVNSFGNVRSNMISSNPNKVNTVAWPSR